MVDIISAREAFNESKYRKRADEILTDLITKIKEACDFGKFETTMTVDSRTEPGAIDLVINDLKRKGYKAVFKKDTAAACEHYYDYITVNWNLSAEREI